MRWVMGYLVAICVLLIIVSQSIIFPTFFMPFFEWQYQRLEVHETIDIAPAELTRVTTDLLDYMRGRRQSLEDVYGTVAGTYRRFFSDIEIRHMEDVLGLYNIAFMVRNIAFFTALGLMLIMALLRYHILHVIARCCREVQTGFILLGGIVAGLIALNFHRAFDIFHHMFFSNDYWVLDPRYNLLINMVPLGFFIHMAIFIGGLLLAASLLVIAMATIYLRSTASRGINL